jgi:pimeloyl-ACP methyl ester carboxylesterase
MKVRHGVAIAVALAAMSASLSGCGLVEKAVGKHISPTAIEGFLKIQGTMKDQIKEYCGDQNLDMSNITESIWWPSCGMISKMDDFKKKKDGGKCADDGCVDIKVMKEMSEFNKKYGGKKVSYKSRAGKGSDGKDIEVVTLTGWWLPAPDAKPSTPRVVVQHGFMSNSNKFRTMFLAYLLRKIGYSVLVNNLRDHCYSDKSSDKIISWGDAYPMDVLGAWDHARSFWGAEDNDASMVGIAGFSMGGFTSLNAFGLEAKIPAAWIDGAPFSPRDGFEVGFKAALGKAAFLHGHIIDDVWEDVEQHAKKDGIDLNAHLPEKELPKGPDTKRPIFVTANKQDKTVAFSSGEKTVKLLKSLPDKYALEFWPLDAKCGDQTHCLDYLTHTEEYEAKLKDFWGKVFPKPTAAPKAAATPKPKAKASRLYEQDAAIYN